MIEIAEITEKLNNFIEELIAIYSFANSKMDDFTGNQKFGRWKEKLVVYIKDNISIKESGKCENLSYPIVMQIKPLKNFNRKINAYKSYLKVLIEELKNNPEDVIEYTDKSSKVIEREKIRTPKDKIKVFISYSTIDKEIAHQVSQKLEEWGLDVFLAHEDIEVSEEWKEIILENLYSCDVFIPLITENFKNSDWTSQEVGIVFAREKDIFIVPLKKGNFIPFGFISHIQAKDVNGDRFELSIIKKIENKYPKSLINGLMNYLYKSGSYREAEFRLQFVLECIGEPLDKETLNRILKVALENKHSQILYATECKKWLMEHLRDNVNIDKDIFKKFKDLQEYKDEL